MMNADEMTGYPSIDKPWLKYYSSEAISGELPPKTIYRYIYDCNEKNMDSIAFKYFGKKITYAVFLITSKRLHLHFPKLVYSKVIS